MSEFRKQLKALFGHGIIRYNPSQELVENLLRLYREDARKPDLTPEEKVNFLYV